MVTRTRVKHAGTVANRLLRLVSISVHPECIGYTMEEIGRTAKMVMSAPFVP